jgi:hypothetical protein
LEGWRGACTCIACNSLDSRENPVAKPGPRCRPGLLNRRIPRHSRAIPLPSDGGGRGEGGRFAEKYTGKS